MNRILWTVAGGVALACAPVFAQVQNVEAQRQPNQPGLTNQGQASDRPLERNETDRDIDAQADLEQFKGHFVPVGEFVTGAVDPDGSRGEADEDRTIATRADVNGSVAFVEDKSMLGEIVSDTAYVALFDQNALQDRVHGMKHDRVEVTGKKMEREGLNVIYITDVRPAPENDSAVESLDRNTAEDRDALDTTDPRVNDPARLPGANNPTTGDN